ncbi:GDP-mannose 4,6-dehydratase [Candidatus Kaiserbacteria bacterium]|nr:GDP-mannose 4,6-dehydratase [Candidatus Kaiserbacteria bacterium]
MKILITGSAGFIGFHLSRVLLKRGEQVIGVDCLTDYYDTEMKKRRNAILSKYDTYTFYLASIADYDSYHGIVTKEKPDVIVHLAAQAGVRYSLTNPWAYVDANYLGTLNVFESVRHARISKVIYASSSSVYGDNEKLPFSESDRTDRPISIYAASKKANEVLAYSYHALYGIESIGLRFFTVYGIYGRPDLALFKFTKAMLKGNPIDVYNNGDMKRSFTYIDDVISGIIALLDNNTYTVEIFNLGGADPISLKDFVSLIEKKLDVKAVINYLPMQPGDVKEAVADISKARKELGFEPKTDISVGIGIFVDWFLKEKDWLLSLKDPA